MTSALLTVRTSLCAGLLGAMCEARKAVHPSQRSKLIAWPIPDAVWESEAAQSILARYCELEELLPPEQFSTNRAAAILLALSWSQLEKIILYIGIAFAGEEIRRAVMRAEILALRENLTDEAYQFALEQALLISEGHVQTGCDLTDACYPEILKILGGIALKDALQAFPDVWERLRHKLNSEIVQKMTDYPGKGPSHPEHVITRTLRELEPEWYSLLAATP